MSQNIISEELVVFVLTASTFFVGIIAGLFFSYSVSVVLAFEYLSASEYTTAIQTINEVILNAAFGVVFAGSIVMSSVSAATILLRGEWMAQYGQLVLVGTVIYLVGTIAVTMAIHIPMNEYIETWSPSSPPDDWTAVRARWARWNHVRTMASIVAFVVYLAALVSFSV
ncbi:anthrone oxygenase family protein [Haladaptatus caseinilyticus]|uniref:anthrone oxygenase family protein n=1 Tax=Haladaptatus caseinilyticus TaxID=2993314 RepID=UPI00224B4D01|nr:anthrone oxygenase family protein [Haladaptatus caseinilyticus]